MVDDNLDKALGAFLAPASAVPDRLFAARVDIGLDDLGQLQAAENRYARGFLNDLVAVVAVLLAGALFARSLTHESSDIWLAALPLTMLLLVLVHEPRQPNAGSSPAP